jgi:hypothetical protein
LPEAGRNVKPNTRGGQTVNARFWDFVNGDAVKLTLKPGQRLDHYQGGPTDEGWHSSATSWSLDEAGVFLYRESMSDGVDCDGRLTSGCDVIASAKPADFVPMYYTPELRRPDWQDVDRYHRDHAAEAAGY